VGAQRGEPVAISTVNGETCALSAVCTHLGGIVRFNDLEKSWDCPLHGLAVRRLTGPYWRDQRQATSSSDPPELAWDAGIGCRIASKRCVILGVRPSLALDVSESFMARRYAIGTGGLD
jgi:nitrite reductase/ring-hydroxylating ferredoxin subunit